MNQATSLLVPLALAAQAFTLVIHTKTGETIRIPTNDIEVITFETEETPEPVQLPSPSVTTTVSGTTVTAEWSAIDHAVGYRYAIDDEEAATTATCTISFPAEQGAHTIAVTALGDDELYLDSAPGVATYTYTPAGDTFTPGQTGTVFAYGTDRESGWYDVDKVYQRAGEIWPGANDGLMCWACSTAGCLQWWIDEYEKEFGHKPDLKYAVPETSEHYSTPMMDIMVSTFPGDAYDAYKAYQWFFTPIARPENMSNNGHPTFLDDSPYRYGGFLQRDQTFVTAYAKKYTAYELFPSTDTAEEIERKFSSLLLSLLSEGAIEITVNRGFHSILLWGADYVVKDDGTRKITRLYLCENDSPTNVIGGLETCNVSYVQGDVKLLDGNWNNLTSLTVLRSPRVVKIP